MKVYCTQVHYHELIHTHATQQRTQAIYNSPSDYSIQLELSRLLVKLRQWSTAVDRLNKCLERPHDSEVEAGSVQGLAIDVDA
jgi:hypothetical protein